MHLNTDEFNTPNVFINIFANYFSNVYGNYDYVMLFTSSEILFFTSL